MASPVVAVTESVEVLMALELTGVLTGVAGEEAAFQVAVPNMSL